MKSTQFRTARCEKNLSERRLAESLVQPVYRVVAHAIHEVRVGAIVCVIEECPSRDCTIFGCWSRSKSAVAKVWRRAWNVKR